MSSPQIQKFGLALDWETSGYTVESSKSPNYAKAHQGLAFGALIFDIEDFTVVDTLYVEIKFDPKYKWDDGAEKIHGLTRDYLAKNGVTQQEAAEMLASFILKYLGTEKIVFLGHRPHFDIAFTDQLMEAVGFELEYDPIKIDSAAFGLVMLGLTKSDLFDAVGLPARQDHNALEDIVYTIETIRTIREFFIKGLSAS